MQKIKEISAEFEKLVHCPKDGKEKSTFSYSVKITIKPEAGPKMQTGIALTEELITPELYTYAVNRLLEQMCNNKNADLMLMWKDYHGEIKSPTRLMYDRGWVPTRIDERGYAGWVKTATPAKIEMNDDFKMVRIQDDDGMGITMTNEELLAVADLIRERSEGNEPK